MTPSALNGVFFDSARRFTPATEQADPTQVPSDQGGFVFEVDDMERARRFLILGSELSFYRAGSKLSFDNAKTIQRLAKSEKVFDLIDLIADVSVRGRAPKQSPGLFALAVVISQTENDKAKYYAYQHLSLIARTASTLFEFVGYMSQFQQLGGMGLQKAIGRWYMDKPVDDLAYQMVKYRQRDVYDHARLLRLSKRVKSNDRPELAPLLDWAIGKKVDNILPSMTYAEAIDQGPFDKSTVNWLKLPRVIQGFELTKKATLKDIPQIVRDFGLSWEMLPTEALNDVKVWEALLEKNVPLGALIRQLPRLTRLGMISQFGDVTKDIERRLADANAVKKARIHPLNALVAMRTYASGRGESSTWTPVHRITDALEETFYLGFDAIEPTGKTHMLALDISGSMTLGRIAGLPINAREASACMAMVTARTEREYVITGFSGSGGWGGHDSTQLSQLDITSKMRLQDVIKEIQRLPYGGTDISLPMEQAIANKLGIDAFVVYTDNELGMGRRHPFQALAAYRRELNRPEAKLITVATMATNFTVANPNDPGMLDIAGFDTAAPALMADFVR